MRLRSMASTLDLCCCITNYHTFHCLKHDPFISSDFYSLAVWAVWNGFSDSCLRDLKGKDCTCAELVLGKLLGEFPSWKLLVPGPGPRSPYDCCQPGVTFYSWMLCHRFPSMVDQQCQLKHLWIPILLPSGGNWLLQDSCDLNYTHQKIS